MTITEDMNPILYTGGEAYQKMMPLFSQEVLIDGDTANQTEFWLSRCLNSILYMFGEEGICGEECRKLSLGTFINEQGAVYEITLSAINVFLLVLFYKVFLLLLSNTLVYVMKTVFETEQRKMDGLRLKTYDATRYFFMMIQHAIVSFILFPVFWEVFWKSMEVYLDCSNVRLGLFEVYSNISLSSPSIIKGIFLSPEMKRALVCKIWTFQIFHYIIDFVQVILERKKDCVIMVFHHLVTFTLLVMSMNNTTVYSGVIMLWLYETVDIYHYFIRVSKTLNLLSDRKLSWMLFGLIGYILMLRVFLIGWLLISHEYAVHYQYIQRIPYSFLGLINYELMMEIFIGWIVLFQLLWVFYIVDIIYRYSKTGKLSEETLSLDDGNDSEDFQKKVQ